MKQVLKIIVITLLWKPVVQAQSIIDKLRNDDSKLFVEYADYKGYIHDSAFTSLTRASLFIGESGAIYLYKTRSVDEFLNDMKRSIQVRDGKTLDTNALISSFQKSFDIEKIVSVVYAKHHHSADYLTMKKFGDEQVWLSDTVKYNWVIVNEFKIINGYRCQRATFTGSKGGDVSVWFTEEIPFPIGPLYISGLPGLILEYYNPDTNRLIKAITISSTDIPAQDFRKWLNGPIVSKDQYRIMYQDNSGKTERMMRMLGDQRK